MMRVVPMRMMPINGLHMNMYMTALTRREMKMELTVVRGMDMNMNSISLVLLRLCNSF